MSRIESAFGAGRRKALIPYITVGYPSVEATMKAVPLLEREGADIIELGIPFSDPLADGATIQQASFNALKNGVTPRLCLEVAEKLRQEVKLPLVFMTYLNPVLSYGYDAFCRDCARAEVSGLIIPDLPPEEGAALEAAARPGGLDLIYLLAPNSPEARLRLVAEKSRGFIYLVSVTGVTGSRSSLPPDLEAFVARVRKVARQPLCVGFGISSGEQARRVARLADGVIIGSKFIQLMEADPGLNSVRDFCREIRTALDEVSA
ncbi:MAG: tryptophan synthase subunit alpha [Chloroflexota bacterium]